MREGVVFEIEALAKQEPNSAKAAREKEEAAVIAAVKTEPEEEPAAPIAGPSSAAARAATANMMDDLKPILAAAGISSSFSALLAESGGLGSISPHRASTVDLDDANIFRARVIIAKKLFEVGGEHHSAATEVLEKLADHVSSIRKPEATEGELRDALRDIASHFANVDRSLSSFELLKSGLIDGLLDYVDVDGTVNTSDRRSLMYDIFSDTNISSPSPLVMLVRRLHESLGRLENFEVETAFNGLSDSSRPSSSNLGRTMRIRLQAEEGQDVPKQVNSLSVTIQAIAPMQALHDFLRPRVADGSYMAHSASSIFGSGSGFPSGLSIPRGGFGGSAGRLLSALNAAGGGSTGPTIASSAPESSSRMAPPGPAAASSDNATSDETGKENKPQRRRSARLGAQVSRTEGNEDTQPGPSSASAPESGAPLSSSAPEASMFPGMPMDMDFDDEYSDDYEEEVSQFHRA